MSEHHWSSRDYGSNWIPGAYRFHTKDYWLRDFLSGILVIGGNSARRGDVISIPEAGILGIILEIRGLQTRIRDLAQGHDIEIPNYSYYSIGPIT